MQTNIYQDRVNRAGDWLSENGLSGALIEDTEGRRDTSLTYFSGHPMDALLFIFPRPSGGGMSILLPWDSIMAKEMAWADEVLEYGTFERNLETGLSGVLAEKGLDKGGRFDLPPALPVFKYEATRKAVPEAELLCREEGFHSEAVKMRACKDAAEVGILREACAITDILIDEIEAGLIDGRLKAETDVALLLEKRTRELGCEGLGFDTLAAGPGRSWGIHCHPNYTAGSFADRGLSLVDFGVRYKGYATDVTMSAVRAPLSATQEEMVELVAEAYRVGVEAAVPGAMAADPAARVNEFLKSRAWIMPHSLGHGVGLDVHEAPWLKDGEIGKTPLIEGMFFTIEPGLYHPEWGGLRWENDFLVTADKVEQMTHSRIVRLK